MNKKRATGEFLGLVVCLLVLTGCDRSADERDKAVAEAEQAKAELARVETALGEIEIEKDELEETIAEISKELEEAKSQFAAAVQIREELEDQLSELTNQRDSTIAQAKVAKGEAERLGKQLKEAIKEIREYEELVEELQKTIEDLKDQALDVEFVPTPQNVVDKMLELSKVKKDDLVYDLGCGDGRIVVTAAKRYGCKAVGYDINPRRVKESKENVKKNKVGHLVRIEQEDIFNLDLSKASVITLYLLPELNVELIPQLEKLKSGSRIVSHDFGMEGIQPDKVITVTSNEDEDEHEIYLWTTPLKKLSEYYQINEVSTEQSDEEVTDENNV
jgi:methylase of polypeptide subunit release factors